MQIAMIGHGAIATWVLRRLADERSEPVGDPAGGSPRVRVVLCRPGRQDAAAGAAGPGISIAVAVSELPEGIDLVVDCAGHRGLVAHGASALRRGIDVLTLSIGALAEADLLEELTEAAREGGSRLHLASGAIGSLDALAAAAAGGLHRVVYIGRKPPGAWRGSPAEQVMDLDNPPPEPQRHFRGDAGEAARRYPKNANVAAAVALAGIGFRSTQVELWADPSIERSVHRIEAEGAFGVLEFEVIGRPLPDNPRSSALAAMSVVAHIHRLNASIGP